MSLNSDSFSCHCRGLGELGMARSSPPVHHRTTQKANSETQCSISPTMSLPCLCNPLDQNISFFIKLYYHMAEHHCYHWMNTCSLVHLSICLSLQPPVVSCPHGELSMFSCPAMTWQQWLGRGDLAITSWQQWAGHTELSHSTVADR